MRNHARFGITSTVAIAAFLTIASAPAQAAEVHSPDAAGGGAILSQKTTVNASCVENVSAAIAAGRSGISLDACTTTSTLRASGEEPVTPADILAARADLSSTEYNTLMEAAVAGTVKSKSYSQTMNNVTNEETQSGKFFYDGSHAWVRTAYRGHQGTHFCTVNWAVGYAVTNKACSESGSTSQRDLHAQWNVALGVKGSPVSWDEKYTLHVNKSGSIWQ